MSKSLYLDTEILSTLALVQAGLFPPYQSTYE